jgi:hypothetical protein
MKNIYVIDCTEVFIEDNAQILNRGCIIYLVGKRYKILDLIYNPTKQETVIILEEMAG